jgi:hypothetical protein
MLGDWVSSVVRVPDGLAIVAQFLDYTQFEEIFFSHWDAAEAEINLQQINRAVIIRGTVYLVQQAFQCVSELHCFTRRELDRLVVEPPKGVIPDRTWPPSALRTTPILNIVVPISTQTNPSHYRREALPSTLS